MAARGQFTPAALPALFLTLQRNLEYWSDAAALARRRALGFPGSELVFQLYPGHGLQIQWLGTFGKLNGTGAAASATTPGPARCSTRPCRWPPSARAGSLGVPVPVRRPGAAVGQLARPGHRPAGDGPRRHAAAAPGRGLPGRAARARHLRDRAARGRARHGRRGAHYLQYSGLAKTADPQRLRPVARRALRLRRAVRRRDRRSLFDAGDLAARTEVPTFDTGAWSLYSRGVDSHESDLGYHTLLRDFLDPAVLAHGGVEYCGAAPALHELPHDPAGRPGAAAHAARRRSPASCASSSPRSRA